MRGNTQTFEPDARVKSGYPPTSSHVLSNAGSFSLTYDAAGRLKTDPVRGITSIGYDNNGLVTSVQTGSFIKIGCLHLLVILYAIQGLN